MKMRKKSNFLFLLILLSTTVVWKNDLISEEVSGAIASENSSAGCDRVDDLISELPSLRALSFLKEVPCKLTSKEEVEAYLDYLLSKEITAKKLEKEEIIFKALGVIPSDYAYKSGIVKLYKDQVGGYYNPEKKYYAMASWMPINLQDPIAIHELTHALQDQHFDLESIMDESLFSDELIARAALIEGDATLVMTDYSRRLIGLPSIQEDESVSSFMLQTIVAASFGGSMKDTPAALQAMLLFPYISGLKFAHAITKEGGLDAINSALKNPPLGSNEILHPEKYLERINNPHSPLPVKKLTCDQTPSFEDEVYSLTFEDILGEFGTSTFLIAYNKTHIAPTIASRWQDDRICFYESTSSRYITWEHAWETPLAQEKFLLEIADLFKKRFGLESLEINTSYNLQTEHQEAHSLRIASLKDNKTQISFIVKK